jgi:hypothetical protein
MGPSEKIDIINVALESPPMLDFGRTQLWRDYMGPCGIRSVYNDDRIPGEDGVSHNCIIASGG